MSDDDYANDLGWHALNYRTAGIQHAQAMWLELEACVNRKIAAEREKCARVCEMQDTANTSVRYDYRCGALDCADSIRKLGRE